LHRDGFGYGSLTATPLYLASRSFFDFVVDKARSKRPFPRDAVHSIAGTGYSSRSWSAILDYSSCSWSVTTGYSSRSWSATTGYSSRSWSATTGYS
jgi:hypothetical protein